MPLTTDWRNEPTGRPLYCDLMVPTPIRVAVLGSTGSVGRQTLDVIRQHPGRFRVVSLAGGSNTTLLEDQCREFKPAAVCCTDKAQHMALKADRKSVV